MTESERVETRPPALRFVARLAVEVAAPITVGETAAGVRRMVPIVGGTVSGPSLSGIVLPGGADYQLLRADGFTTLDARYVLALADGQRIFVENTGIRHGPPDLMRRLAAGETVDPSLIYFRTTPRFETDAAEHLWMTRAIFVATGIREPERVIIDVFQLF